MIELALVLLLGLFLLGVVKIPGLNIPNYQLFVFNNHVITLFQVLTVLVVFGLLVLLPKFIRIVVGALLIILILAILGIITVVGLPLISIVVLMLVITFHRSFHWYHHYRRRSSEFL